VSGGEYIDKSLAIAEAGPQYYLYDNHLEPSPTSSSLQYLNSKPSSLPVTSTSVPELHFPLATKHTLLEVRHHKLIRQPQRQLRMLQHMREAEILDLILRRMDLLVAPLEIGLDDEGGGIACFGGRGVVGAGVAAFREDVGDVAVLCYQVSLAWVLGLEPMGRGEHSQLAQLMQTYLRDDLLDEFCEIRIHKICNHAHTLLLSRIQRLLHIPGHILLQHRPDIPSLLLICRENSLTPQQPALLRTIPMELNRIRRASIHNTRTLQQHPQRLKDRDSPGPIVVSAGSG